MPKDKTATSVAGEWMGQIADLFASPDKSLDQVKKSVQADLEKLKRSTEVAANLYVSAESGFKKDLEELGIRGDAQKEYLALFKTEWQKVEMSRKSSEILSSPELAAMDAFITNVQNLPKLKELIDSAEPEANWQTMIKSFASKIPGLDKFLDNGGFDTILTAVGLGFLVKPKKDKTKTGEVAKTAQSGQAKDQVKEAKETKKAPPKSTIFLGDSNTVAMTNQARNLLKIEGKIVEHAKGGMPAKWGRDEVRRMAEQKPSPLAEMENAVILFGSNDLLAFSPTDITNYLKETYELLKKAGVKHIYAVTIPPVGGYTAYDRQPKAEETRDAVNKWIRDKAVQEGLAHHVIDLAATEEKGGIADNSDPKKLSKKAQSGDGLHFDKKLLATVYQRELEIGTGKTA